MNFKIKLIAMTIVFLVFLFLSSGVYAAFGEEEMGYLNDVEDSFDDAINNEAREYLENNDISTYEFYDEYGKDIVVMFPNMIETIALSKP